MCCITPSKNANISRGHRRTWKMQNRFEMEKCLQERIGLKKMTDTEISQLLLKIACNILCRWKYGVTQKIQSACKLLQGSSLGRSGRNIYLFATFRWQSDMQAFGAIITHVHRDGKVRYVLRNVQGIERKGTMANKSTDFEARRKITVKHFH